MTDLKALLYHFNPWWLKPYRTEGLFWRKQYLDLIKKFLKTPQIIVLAGSRRAGKTSILKMLIANLLTSKSPLDILYLSLDDPLLSGYISKKTILEIFNQYELIRKKPIDKNCFIIIDEVQTMPNWQLWLKKYYDQDQYKFIVSGSSASLIKGKFTELTGRSISLEIFPFNFKEIIEFKLGIETKPVSKLNFDQIVDLKDSILGQIKEIKIYFEEYKEKGGFPEIIKEAKEEIWQTILKNYFDQIIYRDIVRTYKIKEVMVLENLALYLMQNISQKFSLRNIARSIEANVEIVRIFLGYLIQSYLFNSVAYYGGSLKTTLRKMKKIYFLDMGLRHSIVGHKGLDQGMIIENIIFNSLKQNFEKIYYWYDKNKYELDFIARKNNEFFAFEVKYSDDKLEAKNLKGLISFLEKKKLNQGFIITRDTLKKEIIKDKKIIFIPAWLFCLT